MQRTVVILLAWLSACPPLMAAEPPIIEVSSPHGFETTLTRVRTAIESHNLRVLRDETGEVPGVESRSFYFCNFELLRQAYAIERRIGYTLPCRITVRSDGERVLLTAIDPVYAARAAGLPTGELCGRLRSTLEDIMAEAVL